MDDTAYQEMANRNIEYFGSSTTASFRTETTTVDPITGDPSTVVATESLSSVVTGIGDRVSQSENFRITDEILLCPAPSITISSDTTVQRNSINYKIVSKLPKRPGSVILYAEYVIREI